MMTVATAASNSKVHQLFYLGLKTILMKLNNLENIRITWSDSYKKIFHHLTTFVKFI